MRKNIYDLPDELLVQFFLFLSVQELVACSLVSKQFKTLSYDNELWKRLLTESLGRELVKPDGVAYRTLFSQKILEIQLLKKNRLTASVTKNKFRIPFTKKEFCWSLFANSKKTVAELLFKAIEKEEYAKTFKKIVTTHSDLMISNIRDQTRGETLLHVAAAKGNLEIVCFLVEVCNMSVDVLTRGYTPLNAAIMSEIKPKTKSLACVHYLLNNKADPNKCGDGYAKEPLYVAVLHNRLDCMQLLVSNGASLDSPNGDMNRTALHLAAEKGYLPLVQWLVKQGAVLALFDVDLKTPYQLAVINKNQGCAKFLKAKMLEQGFGVSEPLPDNVERNYMMQ